MQVNLTFPQWLLILFLEIPAFIPDFNLHHVALGIHEGEPLFEGCVSLIFDNSACLERSTNTHLQKQEKGVKRDLLCSIFSDVRYISYLHISVWKRIPRIDKGTVQKHMHSFSLAGTRLTCGTIAGLNR